MPLKEKTLGWIFVVITCLSKLGTGILTPLFLDSLTPTDHIYINISAPESLFPVPLLPSGPSWQRIDPFFNIILSMGFDTVLLGIIVGIISVCAPSQISERERNYSKVRLLGAGCSQAINAILFQFSTSGSRTAPYLLGSLGYFYIPIAFFLRFLILRKRPTRIKLLCAAVIVTAEFVSLIPSMFPQLESKAAKREEGGATGAGRILWPICLVLSWVPHAIWSIILEKSVKDKKESANTDNDSDHLDVQRLNMAYVMFWNFLGTFLMTLLLFWVDLIPGFGLIPSIEEFFKQWLFNMRCIFGATSICGFHQIFLAWAKMIVKTSGFISLGFLLRYGEGANFYAIIAAMIQPLRFLTFTLFDEQPFRWHPHTTLSTWLSIAALAVMFPAVIIYSNSPEVQSEILIINDTEEDTGNQTNVVCDQNIVTGENHTNNCEIDTMSDGYETVTFNSESEPLVVT